MAWCPYSDSEMTRPARKAPRAAERPAQAAASAVPSRMKRTATTKMAFLLRAGQQVQQARHEKPRADGEQHRDRSGLADGRERRRQAPARSAGESRDRQHHRHDRQILEDE